MRVDSWLRAGLMLALAVMQTQARFIAKRETGGVEHAVASTSPDPDMLTAARESGGVKESVAERKEPQMNTTRLKEEDEETEDKTIAHVSMGISSTTETIKDKGQSPEREAAETTTGVPGISTAGALEDAQPEKTTAASVQQVTSGETDSPWSRVTFGTQGDTGNVPAKGQISVKDKETTEGTSVVEPKRDDTTKPGKMSTEPADVEVQENTIRNTENPLNRVTLGLEEQQKVQKPVLRIDDKMDLVTESMPLKSETPGLTTSTERVASTTRSSDHARFMQFSPATEESIQIISAVTPMKLRALPMTSTTRASTTSTSTSTQAAPTTTPGSLSSNENAIEESTAPSVVRLLPEKRAKFISENSTNAQQLTLPNTAEVWSLAGMKAVPKGSTTSTTTSTVVPIMNQTDLANDIELPQNRTEQHKEKNLLDWQQIAMMQSSPDNRTEFVVRTTLDATEGATQATTEPLDEEKSSGKSEVVTQRLPEISEGSSRVATSTTARTELLDVPLVKKMSEAATAKLAEAATEAQAVTEESISTEQPLTAATSGSSSTEPLAVTARVSLMKSQLTADVLNATTESTTSSTTTTEPSATDQHVSTEMDLTTARVATSATATTAATAAVEASTSEAAKTAAAAAATTATVEASTATYSGGATSSGGATVSTTATPMKVLIGDGDDEGDMDNSSNDVIAVTSKQPEQRERVPAETETTTATAVSEQVAGEVNTTIRPERTTTPASARGAGTIASTTTPTQTEIAQISNEVNLEAVTVKSARDKDEDTDTSDHLGSGNANELTTVEKTDIAVNNSVAITESTRQAVATATPATSTTTPPPDSTHLSELGKLNHEQESSLETNNIGEASEATTTPAAVAIATDESTPATAIAAGEEGKATGGRQSEQELHHHEAEQVVDEQDTERQLAQTTMAVTTTTTTTTTTPTPTTTTSTTTSTTSTTTPRPTSGATSTTMQPPLISLLDDSTTTSTTTTTTPAPTTVQYSESPTEGRSSTTMLPETTTMQSAPVTLPPNFVAPYPNDLDHMQSNAHGHETDVNVIIAITVSVIGVVALILLVAFLYLMRKRQKQMSYGQRCRPVSLDAYSLDNVSVLGSVRRKGRDVRASKRTYGNAAFDDPSLRHNLLTAGELARFVERRSDVFEEFRDVPQIIARADEVPPGCEDKNRYANVIPLPETRVVLQRQGDDDKTEYINANYVRGPRDAPNYYIACQAPLESTTSDFWRMIWEQQSRVIIQATDLSENGIEKCAEYLPPSATLDNHSSYGDYQVTLKNREVKDRYAISTLVLKHVDGEESRELTHYWYKWPEAGVPAEEAPIIAMLLEARSSLKSYCLEQANELRGKSATLETSVDAEGTNGAKAEASSTSSNEINGNISSRSASRSQQGPLTVHCSPGTGRTGTIIASDMAIRSLETPNRSVDIPQLVYYVRRGRASAVQTKEQYEFIYKVASMYAAKITNLSNDN
ncbi:hypothetical protein KR018_011412 [Drosophila ironensis]|nr:hypothetical protein KR018_011412 [Drosophila ironensis]